MIKPHTINEKRDFWDKLGITGTFLSTAVVAVLTVVVTYQTNLLKNRVDNFKAVQDEGMAVSKLITELSGKAASTMTYDLAFLALERYLRNTCEDGELKPQDKIMLTGFAESLIYDRISQTNTPSDQTVNRLNIPMEFLHRVDSVDMRRFQDQIRKLTTVSSVPTKPVDSIGKIPPVASTNNPANAKSISVVLKKLIYIQYAGKENIEKARKIQNKFKTAGWIAPGVENVEGKYGNVVKYFNDEDRTNALDAASIFGAGCKVLQVKGYEKNVPKGQLEIWIAKMPD